VEPEDYECNREDDVLSQDEEVDKFPFPRGVTREASTSNWADNMDSDAHSTASTVIEDNIPSDFDLESNGSPSFMADHIQALGIF
jgi:hypothetical protein